jgi:hypothetical protein
MSAITYPLLLILFTVFSVGSYFISHSFLRRDGFFESTAASYENDIPSPEQEAPEQPRESVFGPLSEPVYRTPSRVFSPDFNLDVALIPVGVDDSGQLEAPENWDQAGWYFRGAKAGEPGNVLINGHYDRVGGAPAAFWHLNSAVLGDKVQLVDSSGRHFSYQISSIFYVGINDEDRVERVLESEGSSLTLVTCSGVWLPSAGTYDNRLVIKAHLID